MATAMHNIDFSAFTTQETDVDSWIDFSATDLQSPPLAAKAQGPSLSRMPSNAPSGITSPSTTIVGLDGNDEFQTPAKPSHEYERFKQQTGLPSGSVPGLNMGSSAFAGFSNSGIGLDESSMMGSWGSGLPMDDFPADADFGSSNVPAYFFPGNEASSSSQQSTFVDPSSIQAEEAPANVRVWPGMHQQAALARAQQQAQQQRQQQMIQQQQQQRMELQRQQQAQQQQQQQQQQRSHASRRSASHTSIDARTEETIARVVSEMRQNSQLVAQQDADEHQDGLPHVMRMRKDEEDMDEDERLLASEDGKKLSSKERRQLRNKVSARAFRSRRKEYIGQLEGEVNGKAQEVVTLKQQNQALMEENARSRAFIEKLLRHPAFTPFLEDLSRDESVKSRQPIQAQPAPTTQAIAQQFQSQPQMQQDVRIGMTLVPEPPVDLSMLNLNGGWSSQNSGFNFSQPHVFAVTEIPQGPINPINIEVLSGKESDVSLPEESTIDTVKADYPVIPASKESIKAVKPAETAEDREFDNDAAFSLYHNATSNPASTPVFNLPTILSSKPTHFELIASTPESNESAMERVERMCAAMDSVCERLQSMRS